MRERRYTFVLRYEGDENEEFEDEFEDGLSNILETAGYIQNAPQFDLQLFEKTSGEAGS